jgi:hypothetical protein
MAMAADKGITTWSFGVPWEESSPLVVLGNHGSSTWAMWEIMALVFGLPLCEMR